MQNKHLRVLVMIPAYNEKDNIIKVITTLKECVPDVDYVVINDSSTDNTKEKLEEFGANYIDLPVNLGIGGGIQTGYLYALENDYDIAIQIDGDGQHDPHFIGQLIGVMCKENADMVIGSRFIDKEGFQSSFFRRQGIKFLSILIKLLTGEKIYDVTSGFRVVNRAMIQLFSKDYSQDYPEPDSIVTCIMNGGRIIEVPVIMYERNGGNSSISSMKSFYYMLKVSISLVICRYTYKRGN